VTSRLDCTDPAVRPRALDTAADALARGALVVMPTDTVYGLGCDAFQPPAVNLLLASKGRGRAMPPPVLVPHLRTLDGIAARLSDTARELAAAFWPGALTLICHAQPTLHWDLGDTGGTVAVRMPLHRTALAVLDRTGPMAVTSANRTGQPAALTCDEAEEQLGDAISIYLDGGPVTGGVASTIVDATGAWPRLLREGAIPLERLREVAADLDPVEAGG
jgi:L-threonylcarbamoyladenylate synthase